MTNYQLYRTTPRLSGNIQIDLVLGENGITDLHLMPISNNIEFTPDRLPDLLQQAHQVNISRFFKSTRDRFFTESIDYKLESDWFIISDDQVKNWDDTYFAGTKRTTKANYGTQYSTLVPCWIEKLDSNKVLAFKIVITAQGRQIHEQIYQLSDDIKTYLYNYFEYVGFLGEGNDRVINTNILSKQASIKGIDLESGNYVTTRSDQLIKNMMFRERPLMENDAQLTNVFKENKMIVPQLINFNLCFNVDDMVLPQYAHLYDIDNLNIEATIGEYKNVLGSPKFVPFDKSDFYTNYEYIPTPQPYVTNEDGTTSPFIPPRNVLDYLQDNKALPLIHQNKICQPIVHWSLSDCNEYLFNFYDGFGAVNIDQDITSHNYSLPDSCQLNYGELFTGSLTPVYNCSSTGLQALSAELDVPEHKLNLEDKTVWAGIFKKTSDEININITLATIDISKAPFSPMTRFTNWNYTDDELFDHLKVGYNVVTGEFFTDKSEFAKPDNRLWLFGEGSNFIFLSKCSSAPGFVNIYHHNQTIEKIEYGKFPPCLNMFAIKKFIDGMDTHYKSLFQGLLDYMNTISPGQCVIFSSTILPSKNNVITGASEVNYFKATATKPKYVFRLDGNIKPTQISSRSGFENDFWVKKILKQDFKDISLTKYASTGETPMYPSINYDSIIKVGVLDYDTAPELVQSSEYKWFGSSKIHRLKDNLEYKITVLKNDSTAVKNELYRKFKWDQCNNDDKLFNYRIQWYKIEYEFVEYSQSMYVFLAKMSLK